MDRAIAGPDHDICSIGLEMGSLEIKAGKGQSRPETERVLKSVCITSTLEIQSNTSASVLYLGRVV